MELPKKRANDWQRQLCSIQNRPFVSLEEFVLFKVNNNFKSISIKKAQDSTCLAAIYKSHEH